MKGCRPLTNKEIVSTMNTLDSTRNKCLFLLGLSTGLRISELLSIQVKDIASDGIPLPRVSVARNNCKGKKEGKVVPINTQVQDMVKSLMVEENLKSTDYLFSSRNGGKMCRKQGWSILKSAFKKAGVLSQTGCHSLRKTFAKNLYLASGKDLLKTQRGLIHKSINSTISYLDVNGEEVDSLIMNIDVMKVI